jgi:ubiquinone/menaquinone biosynthesis C-methylase UbiE
MNRSISELKYMEARLMLLIAITTTSITNHCLVLGCLRVCNGPIKLGSRSNYRLRSAVIGIGKGRDMSSFVWMKILESTPERYDRGIRMLSYGRIGEVYERIAALAAAPGKRILDIGCGTGGVSLACAAHGAMVTGIDFDAGMLEVARNKPVSGAGRVEFLDLAAAEIEDRFAEQSLDAVVSCLAMSEMSPDEQDYVLSVANSRLAPGGVIVIADETTPEGGFSRLAYWLMRLPAVVATYLLTQTTTRPVHHLMERVQAAGFSDVVEERMWSGRFFVVHGRKKEP